MANLWERITGVEAVRRQVTDLQGQLSNLGTTINNDLQQRLSISFRNQGGFSKFDYNNQTNYIRDGYNISSAVYAIVSDIAKKGASIPFLTLEIVDDKAFKKYKAISSAERTPENIFLQRKYALKAFREVEDDNPLKMLLDNPNKTDDPSTFWETAIGFRLLCGNSYLYAPKLEVGADKGKVTELQIMPSPYTALIVVPGFPKKIIGYELIIDGVSLVRSTDVIHIKYPNYDYTIDGQELYGLPPLRAAFKTLQRSNSAETSSTAMFENGGPAMIIANKSLSPDEVGIEQAAQIKKSWNQEHTGNSNRGKFKLMAGDINAIPLGFSPVDLNILESEKWSFDMLCNVFHTSSVMFNNHAGNTESNVKEMRRDSYTRAVIPERKAQCDAINRNIVPGYNTKGKKYFVDMDISGITELQPDMKMMADWLNTAWWVAPNEKRKMMDWDESDDPNMNKIWIPGGLAPMDDMTISVDDLPDLPEIEDL